VTGSGLAVTEEMLSAIEQAKAIAHAPVAVGFGVSKPEQAKLLAEAADGVIVGSALIREIQSREDPSEQIEAAAGYAAAMSRALKPGTEQTGHADATIGETETFAKAGG
jgi:tryptophan synthase alpha chain